MVDPYTRRGHSNGKGHDVTSFAITGVAGPLGRALAARLDADPTVDRIVGIDRSPPPMPPAKLDFVRADLRDPVPARALAGVDVVVTTQDAAGGNGDRSHGLGARATRQVLDAVDAAGAGTFVHVSTALVYGASETNPVPLTEQIAPRARPDYPPAHLALITEEAVQSFAQAHPDRRVVILRPVTVLGTGIDSPVTRHLESPLLPMVRGCDPPVQFVDVDDVAMAAHLVATEPRARGVYNVAAEGWLTTSDVRRLLARPTVHLPRQTAVGVAAALHRGGLLTTPPGALSYLMHPWVVDTTRLRDLGWHAAAGQREILHRFVAEHGPWLSVGRIRVRTVRLVTAIIGAGAATGLGAAWLMWRRWRARWAGPGRARARRPIRRRRDRSSARGSS
jgi:UDP-glucose 4-epimerase